MQQGGGGGLLPGFLLWGPCTLEAALGSPSSAATLRGRSGAQHSHIRCHRAGLPVVSEQEACVCVCTGEYSSKHVCPIAQDTGKQRD